MSLRSYRADRRDGLELEAVRVARRRRGQLADLFRRRSLNPIAYEQRKGLSIGTIHRDYIHGDCNWKRAW